MNSCLLFSFQIKKSLERLRLSGMAKISFLVLGAKVSQTFNLFHCHVFASMNSDTLADIIYSPMNTSLWDNQCEDDTSIFVPTPTLHRVPSRMTSLVVNKLRQTYEG